MNKDQSKNNSDYLSVVGVLKKLQGLNWSLEKNSPYKYYIKESINNLIKAKIEIDNEKRRIYEQARKEKSFNY